jgi:hypothetical protein
MVNALPPKVNLSKFLLLGLAITPNENLKNMGLSRLRHVLRFIAPEDKNLAKYFSTAYVQ